MRRELLLLPILLGAAVGLSCEAPCRPTTCAELGRGCGPAEDGCKGSLDCGTCVPGKLCSEVGLCEGGTGAECRSEADCAAGACLQPEDGWPAGYCSQTCTKEADCTAGGLCRREVDAPAGYCVNTCVHQEDCREGYLCRVGRCIPTCTVDADCKSAERPLCNVEFGRCVECLSQGECAREEICRAGQCEYGGTVGLSCKWDAHCDGGTCWRQAEWGWAGGYCTGVCATDDDCGRAGHCYEPGYVCVRNCLAHEDCRPGYVCLDLNRDGIAECLAFATGDGQPGATCDSIDDCQGGFYGACGLESEGFPGGYCYIQGCGTWFYCPGESICVDSFCLGRCHTNADCREGYGCQGARGPGGWVGGCLPLQPCSAANPCGSAAPVCAGGECTGCQVDSDCSRFPSTPVCDPAIGTCIPCHESTDCGSGYVCRDAQCGPCEDHAECLPGGRCDLLGNCRYPPGGACEDDADCHGWPCLLAADGWPDGYCTAWCWGGGSCESGSHCQYEPLSGGVFKCVKDCTDDLDCRTPGYACLDVDGDGRRECMPADPGPGG